MSSDEPVRIAANLLVGFASALREAGLPVDQARTATFLAAIRACRLCSRAALARIGRVTLTSSPDDFPIFDDVFEAWFGEVKVPGKIANPEQDHAPRAANPGGDLTLPPLHDGAAAGQAAAGDHLRNRKSFRRDGGGLDRLGHRFDAVPTTRSRRRVAAPAGDRIDLAGTARAARRTFGETLRLMRRTRPRKPRRLLLMIDVSGSMKAHSELYLRFCHLATRRLPSVETFCFGTRLTRVSASLKRRDPAVALARLAAIVSDFDGGTQIGASLQEFLSASRHAALVRGAITIIFSDGLERGDPVAMIHSVERLGRLSHRLVWATPLAADPRYRPATRGMAGVLPFLDGLCDAGDAAALERLLAELGAIERMERCGAGRRFVRERTAA